MQACLLGQWQLTLPVMFTLLVATGVIALAAWVRRQRGFSGRRSFVVMHLACLWWLSAAGLEMAADPAGCKIFWASMAWPAIIAMPTLWAVFLWRYTHNLRRPLGRWPAGALAVAPVLFWLLALSNGWHGLFYDAATAAVSPAPGAAVRYVHGPLFYAAAAYVYLCMLFCLVVAARATLASRGLYRRHYALFTLLMLVPWTANIAYVGFGYTVFGFDPTPFSFAVTLLGFAGLIGAGRLFDLMPVARNLLLEALLDPVLVIDPFGRVIQANPAALRLAGVQRRWQGTDLRIWPVYGARLHAMLACASDRPEDGRLLTLTGPQRYYELRVRDIGRAAPAAAPPFGRMLYLRDVTQRHVSEIELSEALAVSEQRLATIMALHEQLREQALRDPLTGLYNRRHLAKFFERERDRARRERIVLALVMIDIDHFKRINDRFGHLVGDDVLAQVARCLIANLRATDIVFRYGGEEFLVIMPTPDLAHARERMGDVRRRLACASLPTRGGTLHVTFSAGMARWPDDGDTLDALLRVADAALYVAKRDGRNRLCG